MKIKILVPVLQHGKFHAQKNDERDVPVELEPEARVWIEAGHAAEVKPAKPVKSAAPAV